MASTNSNQPPFDEASAIYSQVFPQSQGKLRLCLPALYTWTSPDGKTEVKKVDFTDNALFRAYLREQLNLSKLNIIHKHLWYAGLPKRARPLHDQLLRGFRVIITEKADHHLLWLEDLLLLKPLPPFLLDHALWLNHLCRDQELLELANGMLLSYTWLIQTESDLAIAHDTGLISKEIGWVQWTTLLSSLADRLACAKIEDIAVNPRYYYGELRLNRINTIYRWCSRTTSFSTMIRGYHYGYKTYGSFFDRNTAWIVGTIVYITVVLTAMQVGLATKQLQEDSGFNQASYGFAVLAIVGPLGSLLAIGLVIVVLVLFNLSYALSKRKEVPLAGPALPAKFRH